MADHEWAHYSAPNEEFYKELANLPSMTAGRRDDEDDVQAMIRQQELVAQMCRKTVDDAGPAEGITIEEKHVPVYSPPGNILVRVYVPNSSDPSETFPLYVDIRGGGYSLGNIDMDELVCRAISAKHRVTVINVEYRLAPQFHFPTGLEDSYEVAKWAVSHAPELHVDLKKGFIVAGLSSGGNFTCVITQRARSDPLLKGKITGQVLQVPRTLFPSADRPQRVKEKHISHEQNKSDPILSPEGLRRMISVYKPGDQSNPIVSPLLAESFDNLPPAYIQVAGADSLRDDGLLYYQFLQEAGVPTKLEVYPGVPHAFAQVLPHLEISKKWRSDLDAGIRWLLDQCKP